MQRHFCLAFFPWASPNDPRLFFASSRTYILEQEHCSNEQQQKRSMQISDQQEHYYTVIMRILGKAGLRPHLAIFPFLLPHLSPKPPFFYPSLVQYIHSCCIAGQDVLHFNDCE